MDQLITDVEDLVFGEPSMAVVLADVANLEVYVVLFRDLVEVRHDVDMVGNESVERQVHAMNGVRGELRHVDVIPSDWRVILLEIVARALAFQSLESSVDLDVEVLGQPLLQGRPVDSLPEFSLELLFNLCDEVLRDCRCLW